MSDRIEPIRRDELPRPVPPIAPAARRDRAREDARRERRRRQAPPPTSVTRDDDGTPHVDVRA